MTLRLFIAATLFLISSQAFSADTLTILHTNDFHSRIEPINRFNSSCSAENNFAGKCFGGWARMANAVKKAREASPNSLLVSGGDQFQGSLFYTQYKGKVAAEMMNHLGYDAMTAGNHEFDDGPEVLRGFVKAVNFPVLLSNADLMREKFLSNALLSSHVIERNGYKIGLIGLTPENLKDLASPGDNITMESPIDAVRREIAAFEKRGINRIIVLSHSGYGVDQRLASLVNGIDLIVGGHTNTLLSNRIKGADGKYPTWVETPNGERTAIVQAYAYGKYLGKIDLTFDENGVVTQAVGEPIPVDNTVSEDPAIKQRVAELAKPIAKVRNRVIGFTKTPITDEDGNCRVGECTAGNLVADAMLARAKAQGAEIAIMNGGGLRASVDAGSITMGELLTVLPFRNSLATFRLTGVDLLASLEAGVSAVENRRGPFPQVAGIRFTFSPA